MEAIRVIGSVIGALLASIVVGVFAYLVASAQNLAVWNHLEFTLHGNEVAVGVGIVVGVVAFLLTLFGGSDYLVE